MGYHTSNDAIGFAEDPRHQDQALTRGQGGVRSHEGDYTQGRSDAATRPGPANATTSSSQRGVPRYNHDFETAALSGGYTHGAMTTPGRERAISNGYRDTSSSVRSSRLFGAQPAPGPPPPGPPPSEPPPLPPSTHPFAQQPQRSAPAPKAALPVTPESQVTRKRTESDAQDRPPVHPRMSSLPRNSSQHDTRSQHNGAKPSTSLAPVDASQPPRTPSRHLLQSALDLAQKAVDLDRVNDVSGALEKYREAVTRLRSVMERVGVEPGPPPAGVPAADGQTERRRRSTVSRGEEEGRTLRGIHDAYVARIGLLLGFQAEEEEAAKLATQDGTGARQSQHLYRGDDGAEGIGSLMMGDTGSAESHASTSRQPISGNRPRTLSSARRSMDLLADSETASHQPRGDSLSEQSRGPSEHAESFDPPTLGPVVGAAPDVSKADEAAAARRQSLVTSLGLGPAPATASTQNFDFSQQSPSLPPTPTRAKRPKRESVGLDVEIEEADAKEEMEVLSHTPQLAAFNHEERPEVPPRNRTLSRGSRLGRSMASSISSLRSVSSAAEERPLPPLPDLASVEPATRPGIGARKASLGLGPNNGTGGLVSPTTSLGTISQRRRGQSDEASGSAVSDVFKSLSLKRNKAPHVPDGPRTGSTNGSKSPSIDGLPSASSKGSMSATIGGLPPINTRLRSASQPGQRPSLPFRHPSGMPVDPVPPLPTVDRKASLPTDHLPDQAYLRSVAERATPSPASTLTGAKYHDVDSPTRSAHPHRMPLPPNEVFPAAATGSSASMLLMPGTQHGSLLSPLPEPIPPLLLHRPFHLLRQLRSTIVSPTGGYATRRLHIPREVWSQGGAKLASLETKVKVIELLVFQLKAVETAGLYFLLDKSGGRGSSSQDFIKSLDDLDGLFDECQKMLGKKLGLTLAGVKGKKLTGTGMSNWGNKFARSLDRIANGKNLDSPTAYVDALNKLCQSSQTLDQHLLSFTGTKTPAYAELPSSASNHIELRLRRSSEFFGALIVPFVVEDLKTLLFKYLKHGNRWLDE